MVNLTPLRTIAFDAGPYVEPSLLVLLYYLVRVIVD